MTTTAGLAAPLDEALRALLLNDGFVVVTGPLGAARGCYAQRLAERAGPRVAVIDPFLPLPSGADLPDGPLILVEALTDSGRFALIEQCERLSRSRPVDAVVVCGSDDTDAAPLRVWFGPPS